MHEIFRQCSDLDRQTANVPVPDDTVKDITSLCDLRAKRHNSERIRRILGDYLRQCGRTGRSEKIIYDYCIWCFIAPGLKRLRKSALIREKTQDGLGKALGTKYGFTVKNGSWIIANQKKYPSYRDELAGLMGGGTRGHWLLIMPDIKKSIYHRYRTG